MLGQISSIIAESGINIDNMLNRGREDFAYTLADVASEDEALLNQLADKLRENENIVRKEMKVAMTLTGAKTIREISRDSLVQNAEALQTFDALKQNNAA